MKRTPKKFKAKARALTEPQPSYVSMVSAGANQQPWQRIIKMDGGAGSPVVETQEEFGKMSTKEALESVCKGDFDISQIVFRGPKFDTEEKVKTWLDDGGYEGADVASGPEDGTFEVISESDFETGTTRRIDLQDDVSVYIGVPIGGKRERSVEEEVSEKVEDNASTIVDTAASVSASKEEKPKGRVGLRAAQKKESQGSVDSKDSEDELAAAVQKAEEMLADLSKKGINDVCELGFILTRLKYMVEDSPFTGIPEDAVGAIKSSAAGLIGALGDIMDQSAANLSEAFKMAEELVENSSKGDNLTSDTGTAGADAKEDPIANAATQALIGVTDALKGLQSLVTEQGAAISQVKEDVNNVGETLGERVEALETQGQSRKSDNALDNAQPIVDPDEEKRERASRTRRVQTLLGYERAHDSFSTPDRW